MPIGLTLIHGVATTAAVWDRVRQLLPDLDVRAVARPCSGSLSTELDALRDDARGRLVVGMSGGATLAIALAASDLKLAGAIAHEPAVGRLAPGLLAPIAAAYAEGGVTGFGRALYGPSWNLGFAGDGGEAVARELPMFRGFEPAPASAGQGPCLTTVGELSPPPRHAAARALSEELGYPHEVIPGAAHFVAWDRPAALAAVIRRVHAEIERRAEAEVARPSRD